MDTALPQKFPFILDKNLAKANCTENRVCTSCDTVLLAPTIQLDKITSYEYNIFLTHYPSLEEWPQQERDKQFQQ